MSFQKFKQIGSKGNWFKRNKEIIEFLMVVLTFLTVIAIYFQAYQSGQQVKESRRAIDLQYTPQIAIEFQSNRIPTCLVGTNYSKCDYFKVFRSDIVKEESSGKVKNTSQVSWAFPVNITFYNLGNIGTKLERIRFDFSCDPKGERDWQVDIMRNRILLPSQEITYSNYLFFDFGEIPKENKWCNIKFKFYFFKDYIEEIEYRVWYQNHDSDITKIERKAYKEIYGL